MNFGEQIWCVNISEMLFETFTPTWSHVKTRGPGALMSGLVSCQIGISQVYAYTKQPCSYYSYVPEVTNPNFDI